MNGGVELPKTKITYAVMIVCSVLTLVGIILIWFFIATPDKNNVIDVNIDTKGSSESIEFESLDLIPGRSVEYTVKLHGEITEDCDITLDFEDENKKLTLKNYVYAKIIVGEEIVCDELLSNLFEMKEELKLSSKLDRKGTYDISIIYYMPDTVGNEAQSAEADFKLNIAASNAEDFYE